MEKLLHSNSICFCFSWEYQEEVMESFHSICFSEVMGKLLRWILLSYGEGEEVQEIRAHRLYKI